jgi:hypothetical protein
MPDSLLFYLPQLWSDKKFDGFESGLLILGAQGYRLVSHPGAGMRRRRRGNPPLREIRNWRRNGYGYSDFCD